MKNQEKRMHLKVVRKDTERVCGYLTQKKINGRWSFTRNRDEAGHWKAGKSVNDAAARYRKHYAENYSAAPAVILVREERRED